MSGQMEEVFSLIKKYELMMWNSRRKGVEER
jgi:hypothetical protein